MKLFQAVKTCGEIAALGLSEEYFADSVTDVPTEPSVATLVLAALFTIDEMFAESGGYAEPQTLSQIGWRDELPVPDNGVNDRAIVYGMMSEYFVLCGDVDSASLWRARFEDCLEQTSKHRCGNLPVGRWL